MDDAEFVSDYLPKYTGGEHLHMLQMLAALEPADLLRVTLAAEAAGELDPGPEMACWVFLNRARRGLCGATITQCCLWYAQVSSFWDDLPKRQEAIMAEMHSPTTRLAAAVDRAMTADAEGRLGDDLTGGAYFYYNPSVCQPSWAKGMQITRWFGRHCFLTDQLPN